MLLQSAVSLLAVGLRGLTYLGMIEKQEITTSLGSIPVPDRGLRIITLPHASSNCLRYPNSDTHGGSNNDKGDKDLGP